MSRGIVMRPKFQPLLAECIENGVRRGYRRAFKYVENPIEEAIVESIETAVMAELYEWFEFDSVSDE
jgi:hypothetical protein